MANNTSTPARQLLTTSRQVGELLRRRRKARGISQQELASKLGISQGRLSALENDPASMPLARLIAIVNLLGLELTLMDKAEKSRVKSEW